MKTILYFIIGIILGIITINCAIDVIICLLHFSLLAMLWNAGLTLLFGYLSLNCFERV